MKPKNVLVVGGRNFDATKLQTVGCKAALHWPQIPQRNKAIPLGVEAVVLLSDDTDIFTARRMVQICKDNLIPLAYVKSDLTNFADSLKKAVVAVEAEAKTTNPENNMASQSKEVDGRTDGKNVQRKEAKIGYLHELFTKNRLMATEDVQKSIMKKFGKGLTPTTIQNVRWNDFGVKFGPRGKVITREEHELPKISTNESAVDDDRLSSVIGRVRAEMNRAGVKMLQISRTGPIKAHYETVVERELNLQ